MINDLTKKQIGILEFICINVINKGIAPTLQEIASHAGYGTTNASRCHILALEKKKTIRRDFHKHRAISVNWKHPEVNEIRERFFQQMGNI